MRLLRCIAAGWLLYGLATTLQADEVDIWELQAVDEAGAGTHESLSWPDTSEPTDPNHDFEHDELSESTVVVEGVLLNRSDEYLGHDTYQVYVQGDNGGGVAVYAGYWYYAWWHGCPELWDPEYERMKKDADGHVFEAGDRVRVTGLTLFYRGKTNINERHQADTDYDVEIDLIEEAVGMPTPNILPNVAECNEFRQQRDRGAERYQGTWSRLENVWQADTTGLAPPEWAAGWGWGPDKAILVADGSLAEDGSLATLPVFLSEMGDFDSHPPPEGTFSVTGIFDQESSGNPPYTDGYRLWVKNAGAFDHIVPEPAGCVTLALGVGAAIAAQRRKRQRP
jgi:hypothetical protein